jgi:hypothetical protein
MPNDWYLDAGVTWRIRDKNTDLHESDYRETARSIPENGLATGVRATISSGKEASVYLAELRGAPVGVKVYRPHRTSHEGGRPIKLSSAGWLGRARARHAAAVLERRSASPCASLASGENVLTMRYLDRDGVPSRASRTVRPTIRPRCWRW